jgi:hypothetical protein
VLPGREVLKDFMILRERESDPAAKRQLLGADLLSASGSKPTASSP